MRFLDMAIATDVLRDFGDLDGEGVVAVIETGDEFIDRFDVVG